MPFQEEVTLLRLRRRATTLWFGYLILAGVCAVLTWLTSRPLDSWILYTAYVLCGLALLVFWLIPAWRFATTYTDVTSARVVQRGGLFARVQRDVQHGAITAVEYSRGKGVCLNVADGEPIWLLKVARPKALAEALRSTLAK